jgi:hypothetical protein
LSAVSSGDILKARWPISAAAKRRSVLQPKWFGKKEGTPWKLLRNRGRYGEYRRQERRAEYTARRSGRRPTGGQKGGGVAGRHSPGQRSRTARKVASRAARRVESRNRSAGRWIEIRASQRRKRTFLGLYAEAAGCLRVYEYSLTLVFYCYLLWR